MWITLIPEPQSIGAAPDIKVRVNQSSRLFRSVVAECPQEIFKNVAKLRKDEA
jgi:hypothetical protein